MGHFFSKKVTHNVVPYLKPIEAVENDIEELKLQIKSLQAKVLNLEAVAKTIKNPSAFSHFFNRN